MKRGLKDMTCFLYDLLTRDAGITPMKRGLKDKTLQNFIPIVIADAGITPMKRGLKDKGRGERRLKKWLMQGLPR